MTHQLSRKAQQILAHLQKTGKPLALSDLSEALKLKENTVRSLIESLRHQKLIQDHETETHQFYRLSAEGKRFAKKGLPEIRLVKALLDQGQDAFLSELLSSPGVGKTDGQIGLGWARRNGWITVTKTDDQTKVRINPPVKTSITQHPLQQRIRRQRA